ncbi:YrdB family protein [Nocardioides sp. CCNWLW239]|uniref:YrdB family protein n=1 Tax=Nocardioides sp. CCNWLW239 TaxID=3128902 RepID=UPI0030173872
MAVFGWFVLILVFVDELVAIAAFGVWGWQHDPRWLLVWLLPVVAAVVWGMFASPKATRGGPVVRPLVKVIVFGLASLALLDAGQPGWAIALLVFSVVVNGLAQLPAISRLPTDGPRGDLARTR